MRKNQEIMHVVNILGMYLSSERKAFSLSGTLEITNLQKIIQISNEHGVMPIICNVISKYEIQNPEPALAGLRSANLRSIANSLLLTSEMIKLTDLFKKHRIDVIPYKGPVLAAIAYGDVTMRQYSDLDFFIRSEDADHALTILSAIGYELKFRVTDQSRLISLQSPIRSSWEYHLVRPDIHVNIELHPIVENRHVTLLPPFDELWRTSKEYSISNHKIRSLNSEMLLLTLCDHGCRHGWSRLIWLLDIAMMMSNCYKINWSNLYRIAMRYGAERTITVSLCLASTVFGIELPSVVRGYLQDDPKCPYLVHEFQQKLFSVIDANENPHDDLEMALLTAELRKDWNARLAFYIHMFRLANSPTDKEYSLIRLPESLEFIYRIIRPVRLLMMHFPLLFVGKRNKEKAS